MAFVALVWEHIKGKSNDDNKKKGQDAAAWMGVDEKRKR